MFHLAGICRCRSFVHAKPHEKHPKRAMPLIGLLGDLSSSFGQMDLVFAVNKNITLRCQFFQCDRYRGTGKIQFVRDVRAVYLLFLRKNLDSFQIVLR